MERKPTTMCFKCTTVPCEDCKPRLFKVYQPNYYFNTGRIVKSAVKRTPFVPRFVRLEDK